MRPLVGYTRSMQHRRGSTFGMAPACACVLTAALTPIFARADAIVLKTGSRMDGRIVEESDTAVVIISDGGRCTITRDRIATIDDTAFRDAHKPDLRKSATAPNIPQQPKGHRRVERDHASVQILSVLPLEASDRLIDRRAKNSLEESIRTAAGEQLASEAFTVLTGETTLAYLEDNGIDPQHVCDATCALRAARELKATYYVSGSLTLTEGEYVAFIRLFNRDHARQMASLELEGKSVRDLRMAFERRAAELFSPLKRREAPKADTVPAATPVPGTGAPTAAPRTPQPAAPVPAAPGTAPSAYDAANNRLYEVLAKTAAGKLAEVVAWERLETGSTSEACLGDLSNLLATDEPAACVFKKKAPPCPASLAGLQGSCWGGPYYSELPKDPWGRDFRARISPSGIITILSNGLDGLPDTADDLIEKR